MSKKGSATAIGAFVVGALVLVAGAVVVIGSGTLFRNTWDVVVYFENTVNGLQVGAPVKFKGVEIGSVKDVRLVLESDLAAPAIPVIIEIDVDKIRSRGGTPSPASREAVDEWIRRGLRAQLAMDSFVTGMRFIQLDIFPESPVRLLQPPGSRYSEIPALPTALEEVQDVATRIFKVIQDVDMKGLAKAATDTVEGLNKIINDPDIAAIVDDVKATVENLDELVVGLKKLSEDVDRELQETADAARRTLGKIDGTVDALAPDLAEATKAARTALEDTQRTLAEVRDALDPEAPLVYNIEATLKELSEAARSLRVLADYVQRNPNSILFGKDVSKE
jgi:paraquat-inducible protein B